MISIKHKHNSKQSTNDNHTTHTRPAARLPRGPEACQREAEPDRSAALGKKGMGRDMHTRAHARGSLKTMQYSLCSSSIALRIISALCTASLLLSVAPKRVSENG